jgi:hypothetical protein
VTEEEQYRELDPEDHTSRRSFWKALRTASPIPFFDAYLS